jgi:hypothetical protein
VRADANTWTRVIVGPNYEHLGRQSITVADEEWGKIAPWSSETFDTRLARMFFGEEVTVGDWSWAGRPVLNADGTILGYLRAR